ncbi:hypothetical protein AAZV13_04G114550 [Glycine max]
MLYVLKLGNQTKVINSCLNPIWNEELNFTLTKPLGVSNLVLQRKTEEAAMATKRLKELLEAHKSSSETLQPRYKTSFCTTAVPYPMFHILPNTLRI